MYRQATDRDRPGIIRLWQQAFHETPLLPDGQCFVAELDGQIAAMVHALPQRLQADRAYTACYFYAVATDEAFRGMGLCRGLMAYAEAHVDAQCFLLVPATQSLFDFYGAQGYRTAFYRNKTAFRGGKEISMARYLSLREQLLAQTPHVVYDDLSYAQKLYGLKFYETDSGIAASSEHFTAECLPQDLGGRPYGMIKWRQQETSMPDAYLGFGLE